MGKIIAVVLSFIVAFSVFNSNEIYKKDIRNRLIIQAIGIDIENEKIAVTLQAIDTSAENIASSDKASQPPLKSYKLTGDTIYTAIRGVTEVEGKIPLYSQNRVIILGKSITESNMADVIDFFVRDVENSSSVYIAAAENTANKILSEKGVSAEAIEKTLSAGELDGKIFVLQLYDLINRYNSGTRDFAMPLLSLEENNNEAVVKASGTAVFNNAGYREKISEDETLIFNILCNRLNNGAFFCELNDRSKVSLSIVDSGIRRKVEIRNNIPYFKISISLKCDIAEISGGVSSAMTDEKINEIASAGEIFIKNEAEKLLYSLYKGYNSDSIGMARLLYIFHQDFYRQNEKNLDSVLQKSNYEVEVNLSIRRLGHEFIA